MAREKKVKVELTVVEARALVECATTSGRETYTPEGITLFKGVQKIERALNDAG